MRHISFRRRLLCAAFGLLAMQTLPSLASPADANMGNIETAPAAAAPRPIVYSMVGTWTFRWDWGCHGVFGRDTMNVKDDGTFTVGSGEGVWTQSVRNVTLTFASGAVYSGRVNANRAKGTMSIEGNTGCWFTTR